MYDCKIFCFIYLSITIFNQLEKEAEILHRRVSRLLLDMKCKQERSTCCLDVLSDFDALLLIKNCFREVDNMNRLEKRTFLTAKVLIIIIYLKCYTYNIYNFRLLVA